MKDSSFKTVISLSGRDKGKYYVVLESRGQRLLLADGNVFTTDRPKVKNPRHTVLLADGILGSSCTNEQIKYHLKRIRKEYAQEQQTRTGGAPCQKQM